MTIKNKIVDAAGTVLGYTIDNEGVSSTVTVAASLALKNRLTNATLLSNGFYRANKGFTIPRKVKSSDLVISTQTQIKSLQQTGSIEANMIHGKDVLNICRKIRFAAANNMIKVDMTEHNSNNGYNLHLFDMLKACDLSIPDFVTRYLQHIQPCLLRKQKASITNMYTLFDTGYNIRLYIKILQTNHIVVSFHEDNINGVFIQEITCKDTFKPFSYLLLTKEQINQSIPDTGYFNISLSRGFAIIRFALHGEQVAQDLIMVSTLDLQYVLKEAMLYTIKNVLAYVLPTKIASIETVTRFFANGSIPKLSITSYGGNTLNLLSTLIDVYPNIADAILRQNLLTGIPQILEDEVFKSEYASVAEILKHRYLSYRNAALTQILYTLEEK